MDGAAVIMLKDDQGLYARELGAYDLGEDSRFVAGIFAEETDGVIVVRLRLTPDRDCADWEYEALFDHFDDEVFCSANLREIPDEYNPVWELTLPYVENHQAFTGRLAEMLALFRRELADCWQAIAGKEEEYRREE